MKLRDNQLYTLIAWFQMATVTSFPSLTHTYSSPLRGGVLPHSLETCLACDFFDQEWWQVLSLDFKRINSFCFFLGGLKGKGVRHLFWKGPATSKKSNYPTAPMLWGRPSHVERLPWLGDDPQPLPVRSTPAQDPYMCMKKFSDDSNPTTFWFQPHVKPKVRITQLS